MEVLSYNELKEINGGAFWKSLVWIVGGAAVFLAGLVAGYVNPLKCN